MSNSENNFPIYNRVRLWIKEYGSGGNEDRRSALEFMEIEAHESISSLRAELQALSKGNYCDETMDKIIGAGRKHKFGSYQEWARAMLRWMAKTQ